MKEMHQMVRFMVIYGGLNCSSINKGHVHVIKKNISE